MPKQSSQVSPISVWGKAITELRNLKYGILFVACGEVTEVKIDKNNFIIYASDNNKSIMEVPENLKILQNIIAKHIPNCNIIIESDETSEKNLKLQVLKRLFGNKLIIKGEIK